KPSTPTPLTPRSRSGAAHAWWWWSTFLRAPSWSAQCRRRLTLEGEGLMLGLLSSLVGVVVGLVVLALILVILLFRLMWRVAEPNEALIISGRAHHREGMEASL